MRARGFTLLEVMVAVAILGLSLTVILSAQAGLYSGGSYAQHTSVAIGLARCRMTEIEERLVKLGYPLADEKDEGACCDDDLGRDMTCKWSVERVELPQAKPPDLTAPAGSSSAGAFAGAGGPLGALANLNLATPQSLPTDGGIGGLATMLGGGGSGAPAMSGLESFAMGMIYPSLKPMLEQSIRKVRVSVNWKEGIRDRDITIVQYVTRPMKPLPLPMGSSSAPTLGSPPPAIGTKP